jgi:hypothetical protein
MRCARARRGFREALRMPRIRRVAALSVAGLVIAAIIGLAQAQAPRPTSVEEQIRLFKSMSPEQQLALIRELQRTLPPAQREAIIGLLQGGDPKANTDSEPRPVRIPVN